MDKPYLLLDADGVLLDWSGGLDRYLAATHPKLSLISHDESGFSLMDRMGIGGEEADRLISSFHVDPLFGQLKALPGAVVTLDILQHWFTMVVITACGTDPLTQQMRRDNLVSLFGDVFEEIWCTDTFREKAKYLKMYPPSWWVEDHFSNAVMGALLGHHSVLIDAEHNRTSSHEKVHRVENMPHAGMLILSQSRSMCQ
jgi:FMN phosphatase YigB (HAD superfamily)